MLKIFISVFVALLFTVTVWAEPKCTSEVKTKWQSEEIFKANLLSQGYKIKKFKVTKGNCYEMYGFEKDGKKAEIYFNPVSGEIVKKVND